MALYSYAKHKHFQTKKFVRTVSLVSISIGVFILFWVLYPILSFDLFYASKFGTLTAPIPQNPLKEAIRTEFSQVLGLSTTDYTKASIWFPKATAARVETNISSYLLSIPKLRIENANVIVGGEDLSKSLIHFTGPLPGNFGNPVIFGHSTLIWLYNPKDYKTIFSKLPDLNLGDDIYVTVDNITYKYLVFSMKIVSPDDLAVLEQNYDDSYITLVTCVPPGTYFKRLVVRGKLVKL